MIDVKTFDDTLRTLLRQKPFVPFTVERDDGRILVITEPVVAFCGGAASYISSDDELIEFTHENVLAIRPLTVSHRSTNEGLPMLDVKTFEDTLRSLIRHKPFVPFTVEMDDGQVLMIPDPTVTFRDGSATYFNPDYEFVSFSHKNVTAIRPMSQVRS